MAILRSLTPIVHTNHLQFWIRTSDTLFATIIKDKKERDSAFNMFICHQSIWLRMQEECKKMYSYRLNSVFAWSQTTVVKQYIQINLVQQSNNIVHTTKVHNKYQVLHVRFLC